MNNSILITGGMDKKSASTLRYEQDDLVCSDKCYILNLDDSHINAESNDWKKYIKLPQPMAYHSTVLSKENCLFVIGGSTKVRGHGQRVKPSDLVYKYCTKTGVWMRAAPMLKARILPEVVCHQDFIYVIGGKDENQSFIDVIERYDCVHDKWEAFSQYTDANGTGIGIVGCAAVERGGLIFMAGGCVELFSKSQGSSVIMPGDESGGGCGDGRGMSKRVKSHIGITDGFQRFDPQTLKFEHLEPLRMARAHASLKVVDDKLYLIGGLIFVEQNGENSERGDEPSNGIGGPSPTPDMDVWHDTDDAWYCLRKLRVPRYCPQAVVLGKRIYIIGGYSNFKNQSCLKMVEYYDTEKRVSSTLNMDIPAIDGGFGAVALCQ